jgi:hypothetical protein
MLVPGLYPFFRRHVQHGFGTCGLDQPALIDYVSDLLARFARVGTAFPFRSTEGRAIDTIAGLLVEWQTALGDERRPPSRAHEIALLHHVADYALFMSGLFRERLKARGQVAYYREQGAGAFARCARLEGEPARARVYYRVSHDFQPIADALDALWHHRLPAPAPAGTPVSPLAALWRA